MITIWDLIAREVPDETILRAFDQMIFALNNKIKGIYWVKDLRRPPDGKAAWGLFAMNPLTDTSAIYISTRCDKAEAVKTLIHELAHFLFDYLNDATSEKLVRHIERLLWRRFSATQRETLWECLVRAPTIEKYE